MPPASSPVPTVVGFVARQVDEPAAVRPRAPHGLRDAIRLKAARYAVWKTSQLIDYMTRVRSRALGTDHPVLETPAWKTAMALDLSYDELLRYSNDEREKWRRWFQSHPTAMEVTMQPGGRFPTVGKLIDHIFLVERRHLQRLTGDTLIQLTGLTGNNAPPLFDYGASVRRELEQFARVIDEDEARETRAILDPGRDRDDLAAEAALRHPHSRDPALGTGGAGPPHRRHRATGGARSSLQPGAAVERAVERSSAQGSPQNAETSATDNTDFTDQIYRIAIRVDAHRHSSRRVMSTL